MFAEILNQQLENMSVYIPHVFPNFTSEYIAGVFENLRIGVVDHVDLVGKVDRQGKPYNAAYIHFKYWCSGPAAENMYYRIKDTSKEARIVHDDPWFWILLENTAKKYEPSARRPRIEIADLEPEDHFFDLEDGEEGYFEDEYLDREAEAIQCEKEQYEIDMAIQLEEEEAEQKAVIQFFEDEAAELELQNELFLEDENRCLHKRIAELKAQNEDMSHRLYDAKMQKLAEEAWKRSI
jgi:hypothetical protein